MEIETPRHVIVLDSLLDIRYSIFDIRCHVGLDRCDDADRETPLTHGRADERGDGARGNPREVAKQGAVVEQVLGEVILEQPIQRRSPGGASDTWR